MVIKLGDKVKDIVTGFEGIATSRIEYINGCIQYGVAPKCSAKEKNKVPDSFYIDYQRLRVVKGGVVIPKGDTGGEYDGAPTNYTG